ncbi:hypothetical protein KUCAC02_021522, partial [Chaenocephalus aceratus]
HFLLIRMSFCSYLFDSLTLFPSPPRSVSLLSALKDAHILTHPPHSFFTSLTSFSQEPLKIIAVHWEALLIWSRPAQGEISCVWCQQALLLATDWVWDAGTDPRLSPTSLLSSGDDNDAGSEGWRNGGVERGKRGKRIDGSLFLEVEVLHQFGN